MTPGRFGKGVSVCKCDLISPEKPDPKAADSDLKWKPIDDFGNIQQTASSSEFDEVWHAIFSDYRDRSSGVIQRKPWVGGSNMTSTFKVYHESRIARDAEEIARLKDYIKNSDKNLDRIGADLVRANVNAGKLTEENQRLRSDVKILTETCRGWEKSGFKTIETIGTQKERIEKLTASLDLFLTLKPRTGEEEWMHQTAREALASDSGGADE